MDEENKKEEKTFWQKAGNAALFTLKCIGMVALAFWESGGSGPPEEREDPDEELKRQGYKKTGVHVWYDKDGCRREKEIWSKK